MLGSFPGLDPLHLLSWPILICNLPVKNLKYGVNEFRESF